jgi:hypothetical protein
LSPDSRTSLEETGEYTATRRRTIMTWERVEYEVDNRDQRTTWLWIGGYGNQYLEVDPIELIENMVENCIDDENPEPQVTKEQVEEALRVLRCV